MVLSKQPQSMKSYSAIKQKQSISSIRQGFMGAWLHGHVSIHLIKSTGESCVCTYGRTNFILIHLSQVIFCHSKSSSNLKQVPFYFCQVVKDIFLSLTQTKNSLLKNDSKKWLSLLILIPAPWVVIRISLYPVAQRLRLISNFLMHSFLRNVIGLGSKWVRVCDKSWVQISLAPLKQLEFWSFTPVLC